MNCDWTEKISRLIDGELAADEAPLAEGHLSTCAACRRAKEDFLSLREAVSSYPLASDPFAERRALERVLASTSSAPRVFDAGSHVPARKGLRERFAFLAPRMTPTFASALALVILAVALGVVWSLSRRDTGVKQVAEQNQQGDTNVRGQQAQNTPPPVDDNNDLANLNVPRANERAAGADNERGPKTGADKTTERKVRKVREASPAGAGRIEAAKLENDATRKSADALAEYEASFDMAGGPALVEPKIEAAPVVEGRDATRHFEQAQVLLRSVRNARPDARNAAIADERQRSQKLLYRNMILRREAARSGNSSVERALDSLEPILIDIANLPDKPAGEDVRAIQERMQKKDIVAVLQANIVTVARAY